VKTRALVALGKAAVLYCSAVYCLVVCSHAMATSQPIATIVAARTAGVAYWGHWWHVPNRRPSSVRLQANFPQKVSTMHPKAPFLHLNNR